MSTSNDMLKRIKSLQNEIQQIKEQEKSKGEWLESAESSLQKLSDSISQKTLSLDPSEVRQLEQSTRGSMISKFEKKPNRSVNSSVKSIKEYVYDPDKHSQLQDELIKVQLAERKEATVVSCCLESLKGYDEQFRKIEKVHLKHDGIVNDLQYRLEEAQRIGVIDQDLMNSNKNFSGKIDVVEVENLFECDGEIVC